MAGSLLGVVERLGDPAMEFSGDAGVDASGEAGGEEGVGELDPTAAHLGHLRVDRRTESRSRAQYGANDGYGRVGEQGGDLDPELGLGRYPEARATSERGSSARQRLARVHPLRRARQRAGKLEGVERVPARALVDSMEQEPRERDRELLPEEMLDRAAAQGPELDAPKPIAADRTIEVDLAGGVLASPGEHEADGVACHAPRCVEEDRCRRPVEPLHVVDGDDDRASAPAA